MMGSDLQDWADSLGINLNTLASDGVDSLPSDFEYTKSTGSLKAFTFTGHDRTYDGFREYAQRYEELPKELKVMCSLSYAYELIVFTIMYPHDFHNVIENIRTRHNNIGAMASERGHKKFSPLKPHQVDTLRWFWIEELISCGHVDPKSLTCEYNTDLDPSEYLFGLDEDLVKLFYKEEKPYKVTPPNYYEVFDNPVDAAHFAAHMPCDVAFEIQDSAEEGEQQKWVVAYTLAPHFRYVVTKLLGYRSDLMMSDSPYRIRT